MTGKRGHDITAEPEITRIIADLGAMPAYEAVHAGGRLVDQFRTGMRAVTLRRREGIAQMRADGLTWPEISDLTGLSLAMLHKIAHGTVKDSSLQRRLLRARAIIDAAGAGPAEA